MNHPGKRNIQDVQKLMQKTSRFIHWFKNKTTFLHDEMELGRFISRKIANTKQ